jgi:hypothetical protein
MQDWNDVPWQKKMKTASGNSKKRLPLSPLALQQQQQGEEDGGVDQLYLQEALESIVVPRICNIVSPIIMEAAERRVEYWKQKCMEAERKLQEVLRQTKCTICQKENMVRTTALRKGKHNTRVNTQAIVASAAAASASRRRKRLATVPEHTDICHTAEHPEESPMNIELLPTTDVSSALSKYEKVLKVNSSSSSSGSVSSPPKVRTPPFHHLQQRPSRPFSPPKSAPQPETYKYVQVVRNRAERRMLNGHTCPECDAFAKFVLQARDSQGNAIYEPKDIVQACSRHRNLLSQGGSNTPEDFWELSFVDSIERRRKKSSQYETTEAAGENLQQSFNSLKK